ncbi:RbsD/FucU family protein [Fontivita pretiosa]|uniref:RbsD/FucU family protein n=1 Tax=Fontivita pretiosa TaxID=2989684 RepID=UPI003D16D423
MLKNQLLHPQILAALARAGHGSKVLISDGNYPHWTRRGPNAQVVYLNLAPGLPTVTDVLKVLLSAIPIEAAEVMDYARTGPYALKQDPPIWNEFRQILHDNGIDVELTKIERMAFYEAAGTKDVCLTIATGEQRIYANLLLTIGVVK